MGGYLAGRKGWRGVEGKANVELRASRRFVVQAAFNSVKGVRNQGYLPQGGGVGRSAGQFVAISEGKSQQAEAARQTMGASPWGRLGPSHGWMGKSPSEARDGEG